MTDVAVVDSVAFCRAHLAALAAGTQIEAVPVRASVREDGDEPPFFVMAEGGELAHPTLPLLQPARVELTSWGLTEGQAVTNWRVARALLHRSGPVVIDGVGMFKAFDETGLQRPFQDPDTEWWRAFGVFDLHLVDRVLA